MYIVMFLNELEVSVYHVKHPRRLPLSLFKSTYTLNTILQENQFVHVTGSVHLKSYQIQGYFQVFQSQKKYNSRVFFNNIEEF